MKNEMVYYIDFGDMQLATGFDMEELTIADCIEMYNQGIEFLGYSRSDNNE